MGVAPIASAASRMDGGTARIAARAAMMMVGKVISASTMPPTKGADRGICRKLRNTASPNNPKTIEGTAARLLIFTSIISVMRFLGANSCRYSAAIMPIGNDRAIVTSSVKNDPATAPKMPAVSGSRESPVVKNAVLKRRSTASCATIWSAHSSCRFDNWRSCSGVSWLISPFTKRSISSDDSSHRLAFDPIRPGLATTCSRRLSAAPRLTRA